MEIRSRRTLFLINEKSGTQRIDRRSLIEAHMKREGHPYDIVTLPSPDAARQLSDHIRSFRPDLLVAVGGDGTVSLAAGSALSHHIPLAIIPAGSANGMARGI